MRIPRWAFTIALLGFVVALGAALPSTHADDEPTPAERVDALVAEAGIHGNGPGVAVLVVDGSGVRVKKAYGLANLATKAPIATTTTFELASASKQMTGLAVLLLVQRGLVKIEADVRTYVPELPVYDEEHPITVDHLSRHTSGLPDYIAWDDEPSSRRGTYGNADVVAELARRKESDPLVFVPGKRYEYSNTGYMLLARLVEKVSGTTFGTFLGKELFEPLGMKTAWVHESPRPPTAATAVGYTRVDGRWTATWSAPTAEKHEQVLTTGDGSVWVSLDDMVAWDRGLRAGKPLPTASLRRALAPGATLSGRRVAYAFGWNVEYGEGDRVLSTWHDGSWSGFETYLYRDLAHGLTVAVLSNRGGFDSAALGEAIAGVFRE
jgi:CubicO group peptidase (beta-lactamase class C family)